MLLSLKMPSPIGASCKIIILILTIGAIIPSSTSTTCYSCFGADCSSGECMGDICYSGLHPVGPFTTESPVHVKGCVTGASNRTTSFLNRTIETFASSPEAFFCDWDLCNAPKYVAQHAKTVQSDLLRYAVCKLETPFEDTEDVCLGERCWVGSVHPRSGPEAKLLRGCSGFSIGVHADSYCISPPIVDLITQVPIYAVDNRSTICFCKEGPLCNREPPASLENSSPFMSIMVTYTQGVGIELTGQGNVWLMDPENPLPDPFFYSLTGPGFKLEVGTEWTPSGVEYQEVALRTTPAPVIPESSYESSGNSTTSGNESSLVFSGVTDDGEMLVAVNGTASGKQPGGKETVVKASKVKGVGAGASGKRSSGESIQRIRPFALAVSLVALVGGYLVMGGTQ